MAKKIPSKEEIIERARQLATPIDFEKLEKEGIIEKKGAWHKITDVSRLPEHALIQVHEFKIDDKGNLTLVKFPKSWKRAQKLYQRMTGKKYDE